MRRRRTGGKLLGPLGPAHVVRALEVELALLKLLALLDRVLEPLEREEPDALRAGKTAELGQRRVGSR